MDYRENSFVQPEKKKKRSGFAQGFFRGLLAGMLILGAGAGFGIYAYTKSTHNYVIFGPNGTTQTSEKEVLNSETIKKIEELMAYVDLYYNDTYDEDEIRNALYKGTLKGLGDPYSTYYTEEEYKNLKITTTGQYYGIGTVLKQDEKSMAVTVAKVYENTPAEEAGIQDGDQILKVDSYEADSMELTNLVKKIRGEEGTKVHLSIYRKATDKTLELDVERRNVELPSVDFEMLDGGIGYIQITEFQDNTKEQFQQALDELQKQNMEGLIIDLRDNPGGLVSSVVEVLDIVLPKGTVVYTEDKYSTRNTYSSDSSCLQYPLAVLVNENSASASEIFAGAIKDYNYGTLIGEQTYGKGIVQTLYPLKEGDAIKITTAKYYTPKGNYIHEVGIAPDITLEYDYTGPEDEAYDMQYDNQLQKAIEVVDSELGEQD